MLGRITEVGENFVQVEIAENVQIRIQKQSVSSLMPKGTYKGTCNRAARRHAGNAVPWPRLTP